MRSTSYVLWSSRNNNAYPSTVRLNRIVQEISLLQTKLRSHNQASVKSGPDLSLCSIGYKFMFETVFGAPKA